MNHPLDRLEVVSLWRWSLYGNIMFDKTILFTPYLIIFIAKKQEYVHLIKYVQN